MYFEIINEIENVETIAVGGKIRDIMRVRKLYGVGRWRKMKGVANVRLPTGSLCSYHSTPLEPFIISPDFASLHIKT